MTERSTPQATPSDQSPPPSRRGVLKAMTFGLGGLIAAAFAYPFARFALFPVSKRTVGGAGGTVDAAASADIAKGGAPVKVTLFGDAVRDGWGVSDRAAVGAAWVRRDEDGALTALSTVCPHLGCAIDFDDASGDYKCPCHRSSFALTGERRPGSPAKRGLDPLPVIEEDGRIKIEYIRFRQDIAERKPA